MYRLHITSPYRQTIKVLLNKEVIHTSICNEGQRIEVLISEEDVLSSESILIETSDEVLDITNFAKSEVRSDMSNKPVIEYTGNRVNLTTEFGKSSFKS